jgi:peroxiredoxin
MFQWGLSQGLQEEKEDSSNPLNPGNFKRVKLLPDGSARFTRAMGMVCKYDNVGAYGERSWRYSAVFNNMKIEKLFAEENGKITDDTVRDPLLVSDGKTMTAYLRSTAKKTEASIVSAN